jgi:DNA-binding transcriptional LysR family regulator
VVRKDHPLATDADFSLDRYLAANHMLISRTGTNTGLIDDWLAQRHLERHVGLIVPHFLSAALIVAQTDMVLSLPLRIGQRFATLTPITTLPLPFELPVFNLVMIWHPLRDKEPAHLWLRERIQDVCREFSPTPDR